MKKTFSVLAVLMLAACTPLTESAEHGEIDLVPPVLVATTVDGPRSLCLEFDEQPLTDITACETESDLPVSGLTVAGKHVVLSFSRDQEIGREYRLRLTVSDTAGNSLWMIVRFYGFNPDLPTLVINEFTTQGSKTHPDLVEIKVLSGGNLGGVAFFRGTASLNTSRFVFPAMNVQPGDFILIHTKPEGISEEKNETAGKDVSGGLDASPSAYDFWMKDGQGLSGNNGIISIYSSPHGSLLDAVLYSTRTSDSDIQWRGFGSHDLREQADELIRLQAWQKSGELVAPEDSVNPEDSTATRSICRAADSGDTDGKSDFHIVPTKKASFGRDNSGEVFSR